ncbi:MAG: response regulator transcription factor [Dehalococcoidia bacterium]
MKDNTTILIVDNDPVILRFVSANLKSRGFAVVTAEDGESALKTLEQTLPDLIILDVLLPDINGVELCRRIREWSRVPIIMLTARNELDGTSELLNLGADDYITKPFGIEVLLARVRAVLRRRSAEDTSEAVTFVSDDLQINFAERMVSVGGKRINLSPKEYELLRELSQNAGKVLTHQMLLSRVWGPDYGRETEYLRVYIGRLRNKIEADSKHPKHIHTKSGVGYWIQRPKKK